MFERLRSVNPRIRVCSLAEVGSAGGKAIAETEKGTDSEESPQKFHLDQ